MSSEPIPRSRHGSSAHTAERAFIVIDYQPVQVNSIASMERQRLVSNIIRASKGGCDLRICRSCTPRQVQTAPQAADCAIRKYFRKVPTYDRRRSQRGRTSSSQSGPATGARS